MNTSRRQLLGGGLAIAGNWLLGGCTPTSPPRPTPTAQGAPTSLLPAVGGVLIEKTLRAAPATIDLGGPLVDTWVYGDILPGPILEGRVGDLLRITLDNQLPADTAIQWHGLALSGTADGTALSSPPVTPGRQLVYEFAATRPGTHFLHADTGVQLDRGLFSPVIISDPADPCRYDDEWVVVLDDWLDGTGRTPEYVNSTWPHHGGLSWPHLLGCGRGGSWWYRFR